MQRLLTITNATKANIITLVNAIYAALLAWGVSLTDTQQAAVLGLINVIAAIWVAYTYQLSDKRANTDPAGVDVAVKAK
jgi:hypothetical protein